MAMQKEPGCDTDANQEAIISLQETISSLQSEIDALEKADAIIKFCSIAGADRDTAESLWQAGFKSIESLASSAPEQIDEECQIPLSECKRLVAVARKKNKEEESLYNEIDDLFEETEPASPSDVAAFDENCKAAVLPQFTDNTSEENPEIVMFRRRLARMIVKKLF